MIIQIDAEFAERINFPPMSVLNKKNVVDQWAFLERGQPVLIEKTFDEVAFLTQQIKSINVIN